MKINKIYFLAPSIAILAAIIIYLNPMKLAETMVAADPIYVLAGFVCANIALFSRVMKWKSLIGKISFAELAPIQFFGITISNLTPGKIGEPVKSIALKMSNGTPVSTSLISVIWERIFDVLVMMIFGIAGLYFIAPAEYLALITAAMAFFSMLVAFLVFIMYNEKFGRKTFSILRRFPIMNKISDQFISNFYSNGKLSRISFACCFFWTFIAWLFDGIVFYLALVSLDAGAYSFSSLGDHATQIVIMTCILSVSILLGLLSSLPGGVGGTEAAMILILGVYGVSGAIAGSAVFLGRALTFWYSILLGYFSFVHLSRKIDVKEAIKGMV